MDPHGERDWDVPPARPLTIVAALGGNALAPRGSSISVETQRKRVQRAAHALAPLLAAHRVVITHGNGPQVGLLLLESEADPTLPRYPLDVLDAESEGMIGYLLEQALRQRLPEREIVTLLTQTIVDADDSAFGHPSKPIGPLYPEARARELATERGWALAAERGGFRRVVPSPEPRGLLEATPLRQLVAIDVTVVAAGGGGVPVVLDAARRPHGIEGIVDKDLAAVVLARIVGASLLLLLTDVPAVMADFGTPRERPLPTLSPAQALEMARDGTAAPGSMGPKVQAAARFSALGGTTVIAALEDAARAVTGEAGTRINCGSDHRASRVARPRHS